MVEGGWWEIEWGVGGDGKRWVVEGGRGRVVECGRGRVDGSGGERVVEGWRERGGSWWIAGGGEGGRGLQGEGFEVWVRRSATGTQWAVSTCSVGEKSCM